MKRIYHSWDNWEDHEHGFYDNCSGKDKDVHLEKAIEMFNSKTLTSLNMYRVVTEWVKSCEHNLTNESMNKIAYIGQAACCIYAGIPSTITMQAWNMLDTEVQNRANDIANEVLNKWIENQSKGVQSCLNLD